MTRSTKVDQARLVNAAFRLLHKQMGLAEAAQTLSHEFALSRRQAYRYLEQAAALREPVPAVEPTIAVTVKLPASTVRALHGHARRSGLTLGQIITQALTAWLGTFRRRG